MKTRSSSAVCTQSSHDANPPKSSRIGLRPGSPVDAIDGEVFGEDVARPLSFAPRIPRPAALPDRVSLDGRWFDVAGVSFDLSRRPVLRRVLAALAEHLAEGAARPLTMQEVLAAGWPNERCVGDSGAARVYQTIKRLRQLGIGEKLEHDGRGYWLRGVLAVTEREATAA